MKNLFKKTLVFLSILGIISISLITLINPQASAVQTGARGSCDNSFLGIDAWDCGLANDVASEDDLKKNVWVIAVNVAKDITVIAAYLVIGYVIYGGYLYTFSGGDPNKVATGKKALTQAFIGLTIVMSANLLMSTIRYALLKDTAFDCISTQQDGTIVATGTCTKSGEVLVNAIHWFIAVAGIVSAIFVVYGGISYATSSGEPSKLEKAKKTILYALIGLSIVALAEVITAFVSNMIREANKNASLPNSSQNVVAIETKNINNFIKESTLKEGHEN